MTPSSNLELFDTTSLSSVAQVRATGLDVAFPDGITWSEVMDCRIEPYTSKTIEENCIFALGVHKFYILVAASADVSQN